MQQGYSVCEDLCLSKIAFPLARTVLEGSPYPPDFAKMYIVIFSGGLGVLTRAVSNGTTE